MNAASLIGIASKVSALASLATLPKTIALVNRSFLEMQRNVTKYNGSISAAFARIDVNRINREIRSGHATQATTRAAIASQDRLEEALMPLNNSLTNLGNMIIEGVNEAATFILDEGINPILKKLGVDLNKLPGADNTGLQAFLLAARGVPRAGQFDPPALDAFRQGIEQQGLMERAKKFRPIVGAALPVAGQFNQRRLQLQGAFRQRQATRKAAYDAARAAKRNASPFIERSGGSAMNWSDQETTP